MKKLSRYISLSAATALSASAAAGVVYTDVDPDFLMDNAGENYNIDFNGDGNAEYYLELNDGGGGGYGFLRQPMIQGKFGNQVAGYETYSPWGNIQLAGVYVGSETVYSSLNWLYGDVFLGFYYNGWGGTQTQGPWENINEAAAAFRFTINGNTHYGWARFEVGSQYSYFALKDYAWNDTPNTPIEIGQTFNVDMVAQDITAQDISNKHNGADLEVSFVKANEESAISEYRIFAVKASQSNTFSVADANGTPHYTSVTPNGSDVTATFSTTSKDADGDLITEDVPYRIFVLSVPDISQTTASNMPSPSDSITLRSSVGIENHIESKLLVINQRLIAENTAGIRNVSIVSTSGQIVREAEFITSSGISLAGLDKGMYVIRYTRNGQVYSQKIAL